MAGGEGGVTVKSSRELEFMRRAGQVVAQVKAELREAIRPGVTTGELDRLAEGSVRKLGATPSFKGYKGASSTPFPSTMRGVS